MGIKLGDHALDGGSNELAVIDRAHIVSAHLLKCYGKQIQLAISAGVRAPCAHHTESGPMPRTAPMPSIATGFMFYPLQHRFDANALMIENITDLQCRVGSIERHDICFPKNEITLHPIATSRIDELWVRVRKSRPS